jgi:hypothetical protein
MLVRLFCGGTRDARQRTPAADISRPSLEPPLPAHGLRSGTSAMALGANEPRRFEHCSKHPNRQLGVLALATAVLEADGAAD